MDQVFHGPHAYRSIYAHLKNLDNTLMANQMRSHQLRAERADEQGLFAKFSNWAYDTLADYGMSPGRPLLFLVGLYGLAVIYCYNFDYGTLTQPFDRMLVHMQRFLMKMEAVVLDLCCFHYTRSRIHLGCSLIRENSLCPVPR